ncbi:LacI family DNA-binding transcriptional regulator [Pelagicoccus mobilis]|uniref:LacI family DNA-binding transcriptional regulator n=1 Tax=Pelagicoccus mobilis TaxID=415221 RepID=A0A934S414_9BACT|nr:LacI family DNA-binding transcriptional regulator [Pelagicoccus mobilis]MBK1878994.1 LacI family DNA-binding transcriptional regulator [Pelagicoccus mobilis]
MKSKISTAMIAEKAGVGVSTAGFVLSGKARKMKISEKTEKRVLDIARELGYVPNAMAKSLRSERSGIVGLLYNHLKHNWADESLNGIKQALGKRGYSVFLSTHQFDPELQMKEVELMLQHRFDAIICIPFKEGIEAYERILKTDTPLVFLNDTLDELPDINVVAWNAREAADTAMRHLIGLGRKRFAFLGWGDQRPMFRARLEAFRSCLQAADLPVNEDWIQTFPLAGSVRGEVERLFSDEANRPDAIFAGLDVYGIEAIGVLEEMGLRVPEDVALVGMGDQPGSGFPSIGLSSMAIPSEVLGSKAASLALELLDDPGNKVASKILISFNELIERRSSVR